MLLLSIVVSLPFTRESLRSFSHFVLKETVINNFVLKALRGLGQSCHALISVFSRLLHAQIQAVYVCYIDWLYGCSGF